MTDQDQARTVEAVLGAMTLGEINDGECAPLGSGCRVRRLSAGRNGFVRVKVEATCSDHGRTINVEKSLCGRTRIDPLAAELQAKFG